MLKAYPENPDTLVTGSVKTMIDTRVDNLTFKREDFAHEISWQKYLNKEFLRPLDFIDPENYTKHFLMDLELINYAVMVISGQKRSGKSLLLTWLAKKLRDYFGKGVTLNYRPKAAFGEYDYLTEQTFVDEWVKLTELADRKDANTLINRLSELTQYSKFFNRFIGIDEARKWVWKRKPTARILGYMGELIDLSGHNHLVIAFACPNAEKVVDEYTVWDNRTHEVYVGFNTVYWNHATYQIKHINSGKVRTLHLSAPDNAHLWETHNLISMSRPVTKHQMDEALDKVRYNKDEDDGFKGNLS
jgi:hypothetical protein